MWLKDFAPGGLAAIHYDTLSVAWLFLLGLVLLFTCGFLLCVYRLTLHPLAHFPGPKLWAVTRLTSSIHLVRGNLHTRVKELHDKYGSVVRVAPDELSFIDGSVWPSIAAGGYHNKGLPKDEVIIGAQEVKSIVDSNDRDHTYLRRLLTRSFSSQSIEKQQPILEKSLQKFIGRLQHFAKTETSVNIVKWFNFLTFDIAGDLVFDESFNQLDENRYNPWVELVCSHLTYSGMFIAIRYFPPLDRILPALAPTSLKRLKWRFVELARQKIVRRLERDPSSLKHQDVVAQCLAKGALPSETTRDDLIGTFTFLIIAGSETSATVLGGVMNYLCQDSVVLGKLQDEIRAVSEEADLDMTTTSKMPYLNAVLQEGLRLCTPVASALCRITPPEGMQICGQFIPGGTRVGVPPLAANLAARNFHDPSAFAPERWLQTPQKGVAHDPAVMQPFGYGGRNCVGQNLAWVMIRLILARFVYNFDVKMQSGTPWQDQRTYILWQKQPLDVRLQTVQR